MKRILFTILGLITLSLVHAQSEITLNQLLDSAVIHYPTYRQVGLLDNELELRISTLKNQNLPQFDINGKSSFQSEVTALPIKLPGISVPELSKDQYKITLDVTQTIYKGGLTAKQINLEEINSQINKTQSFIELYALRQRVSGLFFQILLIQKQIEIIGTTENTLNSRLKEIQSGIKNGVLLTSVGDNLSVEILKIQQQKIELRQEKQKIIQQVNILTGFDLDLQTKLQEPNLQFQESTSQYRLENQLFELQKQKLIELKNISKSRNLPMVYGFGTIGYGRPGFNMLSNSFEPFGMVGVGLNYKLWNWNEFEHDRKILDINVKSISIKQETFDIETQISKNLQLNEIEKLNELAKTDDQIMALRRKIVETSNAQMINGTATASNYIEDLNKLNQAIVESEMHKIKKSIAIINYLWLNGKL